MVISCIYQHHNQYNKQEAKHRQKKHQGFILDCPHEGGCLSQHIDLSYDI